MSINKMKGGGGAALVEVEVVRCKGRGERRYSRMAAGGSRLGSDGWLDPDTLQAHVK